MAGLGVGEYNTCELKSLTNCCCNNLPLHKRFVITINFNKWGLGTGVFLINPLRLAVLTARVLRSVSDNRSPLVSCSYWETTLLRSKLKKAEFRLSGADGECLQSLPPPQPWLLLQSMPYKVNTWDMTAQCLPLKLLYEALHQVPLCFFFMLSLVVRAFNMMRAHALTPTHL